MEKLKPCPFCGSANVGISPYDGAKTIICMYCLCQTASYRGEDAEANAIAAWNRRAAPENKPDPVPDHDLLCKVKIIAGEMRYQHRGEVDDAGKDWLVEMTAKELLREAAEEAAPENKALTLEQLQKMDKIPVWVGERDKRSHIGEYGLVDTVGERIVFNRSTYITFKAVAGKTAYARKPERSKP